MSFYELYLAATALALVVGMICLRKELAMAGAALGFTAIVLFLALISQLNFGLIESAIAAILVVLAGLTTYLFLQFISELWSCFEATSGPKAAAIIGRVLFLWSPTAASILLMSLFAAWRDGVLVEQAYKVELASWHCNRDTNLLLCQTPSASLQQDLHLTNRRLFEEINERALKKIEQLRKLPSETKPAFEKAVNDAMFDDDPAIPTADSLLPRMRECAWYQWLYPPAIANCIKALIVNPVHDAYDKFRSDLRRDINGSINDRFTQLQTTSNALSNTVRLNLDRRLQLTQEAIDTQIDRTFFLRRVLNIAALVSTVLLAMKILLYIFMRVAFDEKIGCTSCPLGVPVVNHTLISAQSLLPDAGGSSESGEGEVSFPSDNNDVWFITNRVRGARPSYPGKVRWPKKSALLVRRLLTWRLIFDRYDGVSPPIQAQIGYRFCLIALEEGECVSFSMSSLYAFTERVSLGSAIRIRAAVILQRRIFFATATGPGKLVLIARGGALSILPQQLNNYSGIDDIIGFDISGTIRTRAEHGFIETYLRSFSVTPDSTTLVIRQAPLGSQWSLVRIVRRFAAMILPF